MKVVYVRWRDSMRDPDWRSAAEARTSIDRSLEAESVGFLIAESDTAVLIALNHQQIDGFEEMVGETITLPREAIIEQRTIDL